LFLKVLSAFYQACDQRDLEVAKALLDVLRHLVASSVASYGADHRQSEQDLIVAHERLGKLAPRR
jgi:hypothetical protein